MAIRKYKPKAGTYYDREKKIQHIEGIDVIFMGLYIVCVF